MAKVFVGNFSFAIDEEKLKEYFSQVGPVISAKVMKEGQGGRSRGFGFVEFASAEDAAGAIARLDGSTWEGRVVKVSEDRSNRRHEQSPSSEGGHSSGGERGGSSHSDSDDNSHQRSAPMG